MRNNEKAAILEPRHPKILLDLEEDYLAIRRFRQAEQIHDRLIELRPDDPGLKISKAYLFILGEKADLKNYLAVFGTVPSSLEARVDIVSARIYSAVLARDWTKAKEILGHSRNEEFEPPYYNLWKISRGCYEILLVRLQGGDSVLCSCACDCELAGKENRIFIRNAGLLSSPESPSLGERCDAVAHCRSRPRAIFNSEFIWLGSRELSGRALRC